VTPNDTTIRGLREARNKSLRALSDETGLDRGYLSRLERGLVRRPGPEKLARIAEVLEVSPDDIDTPGDAVTAPTATKKRTLRAADIRPDRPNPATPEGELFVYTPAEAAEYLPLSMRELRERAYRREIRHGSVGNRIFFTGLHIRALLEQLTVPAAVLPKQRTSA
jgi:transcriptional regulator with XRE-family HTH domain